MPIRSRRLSLCGGLFSMLLPAASLFAQSFSAPARVNRGVAAAVDRRAALTDTLRLYYLGYAIGRERYELEPSGDGFALTADFDYVDRGRRTHLQGELRLASDYTPRHLEVTRLTDSWRTVVARVDLDGRRAVQERGETAGGWRSNATRSTAWCGGSSTSGSMPTDGLSRSRRRAAAAFRSRRSGWRWSRRIRN
jgi:hypothetical protein